MVTEYTTIDMYYRFILFLVEYFRPIDGDLSEDAIPSEMLNVCASHQVTSEVHFCNSSTNELPHLFSVASTLSSYVELPVQRILMKIAAE